MNTQILSLIILLLSLEGCSSFEKDNTVISEPENFICPPIESADIPFDVYNIEAGKGDTIFPSSGSILFFPPNAFIDREGNIVQGNVQLKYREFSTPIDFYLSGISMEYDSLNKHYNFESSGMCQVLAYKDGKPIFVNPISKPEVYLTSNTNSDLHNVYYLDTTRRKWINKGKSIVVDISNKFNSLRIERKNGIEKFSTLEEPIMPDKASIKSPVLKIVVDPASVNELLGYDNLKFQVIDNIEKFDPNESNEEWKNVEIRKSEKKGQYIVEFINDKKTITHTVKPVLEGKDYDEALNVFERKQIEYVKQRNLRLENEKKYKDQYVKDSIKNKEQDLANEKIARLNILIEARNKEIIKTNAIINEQNLSNKILRGFNIDSFGVINCDLPIIQNNPTIMAIFKDKSGNIIELKNIAVLYESFRGLMSFYNNNIKISKDDRNFICGTYQGGFAYLSFKEFANSNLDFSKNEQSFVMNIVPESKCTYDYIKELAYE